MVNAAARLLEARPRSVAEVRRRLTTAGYQPVLIEGALARLVELGYLDDEAFARAWIESRDRAHPRGERALRGELVAKGIERELLARLLEERDVPSGPEGDVNGESVDLLAARRLLERRRAALMHEQDAARIRQKAYALLARNGFDPETARTAASAFASGLQGADDAGPDVDSQGA